MARAVTSTTLSGASVSIKILQSAGIKARGGQLDNIQNNIKSSTIVVLGMTQLWPSSWIELTSQSIYPHCLTSTVTYTIALKLTTVYRDQHLLQ